MSRFARKLADSIERYVGLHQALGYQFRKQAASLHVFLRYVRSTHALGPLSQSLAVDFVMAGDLTPNGRAIRYAMIRRFAAYHAAFDPDTESLDLRALPRSRAIPPPRILSDQELCDLVSASRRISSLNPLRGHTLATIVGLLSSTGLRSGEALRLDRSDVDLVRGVLQIRKSKFRKDRLVPVHATTLTALRDYDHDRDLTLSLLKSPAFFVSTRGNRLSHPGLYYGFTQACALAGLNTNKARALRPHDLRHRFVVTRLASWQRDQVDAQSLLPLLATYMGHARYSDTAYYVTSTSELLSLASANAFGDGGAS